MVSTVNRMLLRDLRSMVMQVITIALVIGCGIAAFIGSLSTYQSIKQSRDDYYQSARFADVFSSVKRAPNRVLDAVSALNDVAQVQARLQFLAQIDVSGVRQPMTGAVISLDRTNPAGTLNRISLRSGNWPQPGSDQVLVHETLASKRAIKIGDEIRILLNGRIQTLTVSGIALSPEFLFAAAAFGSMDETSFGVFWMDQERLEAALDMKGAFNEISVKVRPGGSVNTVKEALDNILEPHGSTGAYLRKDQPSNQIVVNEINGQRAFGIVLPTVFLAVAIFIMNVVISRQVATQRETIATLKALGHRDFVIVGYYLKLSALIVLLGLVVGLAVGKWYGTFMTGLYVEVFKFPSFRHQIVPWVWLVPFLANLIAAIVSTLYATRSILSLSPAQAMQPPSPASYEPGWPEKLGISQRTNAAFNMTIRHMQRHPTRSLLAVVGVAGAVGMLISGTWWRDSIDYVLDTQFGFVQRSDIHLGFTEPVDRRVESELRRLPGVLEVATQRNSGVKLHHGHRSKLTTIQGIRPGSTQRAILDQQRRPIAMPVSGMVLGKRIADQLGVRPGQRVWVEFLDRRSTDQWVTVATLVDEMMASGAYLKDDVLDAMIDEPGTVNWAGLMIDPHRLDDLYQAVKETPKAAGIVVKAELLRHINETSTRNILVFTTILTIFASLIAVGVTYNSARISLSERAWELATLRVLGLTEKEVWLLLIGDMVVGLVIGIPLGWLFGTGLAWYLKEVMGHEEFAIPLVIYPRTYAYAAVIMITAALLTLLTIRRRLNRLNLISVLKTRE